MCHYVYVCIRIARLGLGVRLKPKDMHTENRPKSAEAKSVKRITAALDSSCHMSEKSIFLRAADNLMQFVNFSRQCR